MLFASESVPLITQSCTCESKNLHPLEVGGASMSDQFFTLDMLLHRQVDLKRPWNQIRGAKYYSQELLLMSWMLSDIFTFVA